LYQGQYLTLALVFAFLGDGMLTCIDLVEWIFQDFPLFLPCL